MKTKSVATFLAVLAVIAMVLAFGLRRCGAMLGIVTEESATATPAGAGAAIRFEPDYDLALAADLSLQEEQVGIPGLKLRLARPLMFDTYQVRGLAAVPDYFYVASVKADMERAMLYQVRRDTYTVDKERELEWEGKYRFGGLHLGPDGLMAVLAGNAQDATSVVLRMDPQSLETIGAFEVPDQIRAVAQAGDGNIYGINESSEFFYRWATDGTLLERSANGFGTSYYDMAVVRGSLVCSGYWRDRGIGVIDVIDPTSFTLLARHPAYAHSMGGRWVTQLGFDCVNGEFLFLPDDGNLPMLLTYVLADDMTLEEYIPSSGQ
ncbi:MAG: hypothetical protein GX552_13970 [Chloroflexi bacterium]|nr:hypothetical protein [Chloroflexota bacterium]